MSRPDATIIRTEFNKATKNAALQFGKRYSGFYWRNSVLRASKLWVGVPNYADYIFSPRIPNNPWRI